MLEEQHAADVEAIEEIIARQFNSLSWQPGSTADWESFLADFLVDATLYPAARPVRKKLPSEFVERMAGLARGRLAEFSERVLGTEVTVFGNVAVAAAGCEITENGTETTRGVEMLLLVKDSGRWKIVSQAWDTESPTTEMPANLVQRLSGKEV